MIRPSVNNIRSSLLQKSYRCLFSRPTTGVVGRRCFSSSTIKQEQEHYDVTIVGGGVVGLTMAKLLQEQCPSYSVAILERGSGFVSSSASVAEGEKEEIPSPRSYALSPKSLKLLQDAFPGELNNKRLANYNSMQVWEGSSPAMLVFSHLDLEEESKYLGTCVEDSFLVQNLWSYLQEKEDRNISLLTNTSLKDLDVKNDRVTLSITNDGQKDSVNNDNRCDTLSTDLLIAADGAGSPIRSQLGIPFHGFEYGRTAITFTVEVNEHFLGNSRAYQRFLENGPIALLPTYSKNHFVVVWSTTPQHAKEIKSMDQTDLVQVLNDTLQRGPERIDPLFERENTSSLMNNLAYGIDRVLDTVHYGMGMRHWSDDDAKFVAPPSISKVVTQRFAFPLSCKVVPTFRYQQCVALIGDAAHTVHPLAGQGLNLGLDDVDNLISVIRKSHDAGMDPGIFLDEYQRNRQRRIPAMVGGIHAIHSLFENKSTPLLHGKSIGLSLINQVTPLRRQLAKIATGM